ncbi:MAG TPA: EAL domain-containing protein [Gammaproteobacteria bacterium]|nr:EAL domain-containing protein [Gammaproteobacteria bacterium]
MTSVWTREVDRRAAKAETRTVLLIAESPALRASIARHLEPMPVALVQGESIEQCLAAAEADAPAAILLDDAFGETRIAVVLEAMRQKLALSGTPIILLISADDDETVSRAFALGAADYLRKPVRAPEIKARVSAAVETRALLTRLGRQAQHDTLTGLPNRALVAARIEEAIRKASKSPDRHFGVLFLNFDHFRNVNDSLGYAGGDELLRQIAVRLRRNLRVEDAVGHDARPPQSTAAGAEASSADEGGLENGPAGAEADETAGTAASEAAGTAPSTVARVGGDEFVVLLDGLANPADSAVVAHRLTDLFCRSYRIGGHEVFATASVGVVTSEAGHTNAEELLRDAETAMREAKAAGKRRYLVFERSMRTRRERRTWIENDLHKAADREELFLMYQPIVSLGTGRLESVEALLRWRHPRFGLVGPDEFIPIAEDTGLIVPIGEWVLEEACRQLARWRAVPGRPPLRMSVNVARRQLLTPNLAARVEDAIRSARMLPADLVLEVTESQMMTDVQTTMRALNSLGEIGVKISMDDFGTGHSSLACLRDFPLSHVKIDRSFVTHIGAGRDLMAVLNAIIELAHDLGIETVAEGIETIEQLASLQALNCDYGQGFYLSRPQPAAALPDLPMPSINEEKAARDDTAHPAEARGDTE